MQLSILIRRKLQTAPKLLWYFFCLFKTEKKITLFSDVSKTFSPRCQVVLTYSWCPDYGICDVFPPTQISTRLSLVLTKFWVRNVSWTSEFFNISKNWNMGDACGFRRIYVPLCYWFSFWALSLFLEVFEALKTRFCCIKFKNSYLFTKDEKLTIIVEPAEASKQTRQ